MKRRSKRTKNPFLFLHQKSKEQDKILKYPKVRPFQSFVLSFSLKQPILVSYIYKQGFRITTRNFYNRRFYAIPLLILIIGFIHSPVQGQVESSQTSQQEMEDAIRQLENESGYQFMYVNDWLEEEKVGELIESGNLGSRLDAL